MELMYRQPEFSRRAHVGIVVVLYALLVTAPLVLPMAAIAGGIELDSREYKLMLSLMSLPVRTRY